MVRRLLRGSLLIACLVAAAGAASACDVNVADGNFNVGLASGKATDTWTRTYKLPAGGRLDLRNTNGGIIVEPAADGAPLEVTAERTARSSSDEAARELLKKIEIHDETTANGVLIETRAPKTSGRDGHDVKYTVKLPAGVKLEARTVNGGIELHQVNAEANVTTTNGGIKGEGLAGPVEARTTNGGIDVAVASATGPITLETVNGGISLEVPSNLSADLSAHVTNGGIHVDDVLKFEAVGQQTRRSVEGKLNGGGRRLEASTTNGGIRIHAK
jgi:hypothetical protein